MRLCILCIFLSLICMPCIADDSDQPKKQPLNTRGLMCEKIEFSELNTYTAEQLEQLICSYDRADKNAEEVHKRMMDKYNTDARMSLYLLNQRLKESNKCLDPQIQVKDIISRKYPDFKIDCYKF